MDPFPSPREGLTPFHQSQQHGAEGHKERKQRPKLFHKRPPYNPYFHARKSEHDGGPQKIARSHSCFNCGLPDHRAQDCPETRKTVPNATDENYHPSKRQRTGGPAITRYSVPDHMKQPYGASHMYPQQSAAQAGYMPYGSFPPTPVSGHSQASSPWQQCPPYPSPAQPYPPSWSYGMSTPTVSGNPQFPTPVSAHDAHQDQGYFPPQSPQLAFNNDQQYSSKGFDRSSRDVVPGPPCYYPSYRDETLYGVPRSGSWTEGTQSSDRWLTSRSAGGQIIWKPPNPVARPLPSRFSASEEPLSSLATLEPGISVSKYISNKSPENFARHIRDTDDWPSVMDDPIFRQIQMDCELISIKELISRRDEVYITHNVKVINAAEDGEITENTQDHSGLNIDTSDTAGVGYPAGRTDDGECFDVVSSQRYTEEKPKIHRRQKRVFDEMESSHPGGSCDKNSSGEQNSKPDEDTQQSDTQDKHPPQNYQRHTSMHKRPKWDNGFPSRNYHDRGFASNRPPQQNKIPRGLQISPDPKNLREKPQKRAHKSDLHPKDSEPKPQLSPQPRSEKNKRTQQTDSHESENDGPRRQDDDVNPKSKRIRPQTVSAYSRRW